MPHLILLDYDGVIVDSSRFVFDQTKLFCEKHGFSFKLHIEDLNQLNPTTFTELAKLSGMPRNLLNKYQMFLVKMTKQNQCKMKIFSGMPNLLKSIGKRHRVCIVTANDSRIVFSRLKKDKLDKYIDYYYGCDHPGGKSDHILLALERYRIKSSQAWMIGDSVSDIAAAKKANVNALAVSWGWQSFKTLAKKTPDLIFANPADLKIFLDKLD